MTIVFRERRRREGGRSIDRLPPVCALTGDQTHDLSVRGGQSSNPLSHPATRPGLICLTFKSYTSFALVDIARCPRALDFAASLYKANSCWSGESGLEVAVCVSVSWPRGSPCCVSAGAHNSAPSSSYRVGFCPSPPRASFSLTFFGICLIPFFPTSCLEVAGSPIL